jgi:hypothetical protein
MRKTNRAYVLSDKSNLQSHLIKFTAENKNDTRLSARTLVIENQKLMAASGAFFEESGFFESSKPLVGSVPTLIGQYRDWLFGRTVFAITLSGKGGSKAKVKARIVIPADLVESVTVGVDAVGNNGWVFSSKSWVPVKPEVFGIDDTLVDFYFVAADVRMDATTLQVIDADVVEQQESS